MNSKKSNNSGGSLRISTDVIAKIAKTATLEVDGTKGVASSSAGFQGVLNKMSERNAIDVLLFDDMAEITINVIVEYGQKIQPLSLKIQENIKAAVQNMTGIAVSRVNVVIAGVEKEAAVSETEQD